MENTNEKDKALWKLAKKRVEFRRHLAMYFIVNAFFWALWLFGKGRDHHEGLFPWPLYPMLGWGIGLAFHFMGAFVFPGNGPRVEKEYERLKSRQ